jgi:hypothetical protein
VKAVDTCAFGTKAFETRQLAATTKRMEAMVAKIPVMDVLVVGGGI